MAQTKKGVKKVKEIHGKDCYSRWGKQGGNPVLIAQGMRKELKEKEVKDENSQ